MISVLIIENENEKNLLLHEALRTFDNLNIVLTKSIDLAKETNSKQYFDLVFIDSFLEEEKSIQCIKNIKSYNPLTMIILLANENSQDEEHQFLSIGVKDFLNISIHTELLLQRIENYIEIINLKKKNLFNTDVFNLFNKNVYQHMITFRLNSHTARVEFWDYFMVDHFSTYKDAKELVGILYATASWLFLNNEECEIVKETSNDSMYLTLFPIDMISNDTIEHILKNHKLDVDYLKKDSKLSIKFEKINAKNDEIELPTSQKEKSEQQKILSKTHFNKTTAATFVEMTAVSYIDKIENLVDLEDEIDLALIDFENEATVKKINNISQKFSLYIDVIKLLVEFEHLVFALSALSESLKSVTQEELTAKEVKKFTTLMLHLLHDLGTWRDNIFVKQEANDIHYLDSSLLSSALQIETIFGKKELEEDDDSFELF